MLLKSKVNESVAFITPVKIQVLLIHIPEEIWFAVELELVARNIELSLRNLKKRNKLTSWIHLPQQNC